MGHRTSLLRRLGRILWLIRQDDLAAVLIHLNDLYLIEDRPDEIPGLPRIAALVKCVRRVVSERLGEDRTLVLHSGDFLSPSLMSNNIRLRFKGEQMIELLNLCEINYATLGNHEFDFGRRTLAQRVSESRFSIVLSNLQPPPDFPPCEKMILWPSRDPFLAILGLSGRETREAAEKEGFTSLELESVVSERVEDVRADGRVGGLVALTHMDRDEDRKVQRLINHIWAKRGNAYVLAGHDHDIDWLEGYGYTLLSKNPSNGRSVTIVLLRKSAVAAPDMVGPAKMAWLKSWAPRLPSAFELENELEESALPSFDAALASAIEAWRDITPKGVRMDFANAFERLIREEATHGYDPRLLREDKYWGTSDRNLIEQTAGSAYAERERKDFIKLDGKADLTAHVEPDPDAARAVQKWVLKSELKMDSDGGHIVRNFSGIGDVKRMDAREASLRRSSTNFGNFVADAIKAATGSEIALINAGSFRRDDFIPLKIARRDLWETFHFDEPRAVSLIKLTAGEVMTMYHHAATTAGGAFLQVTESEERVRQRHEEIQVAVATFLLKPPGDGYPKILAGHRHCSENELLHEVLANICQPEETIVELIEKGATLEDYERGAKLVDYSDELRLLASSATMDGDENLPDAARKFIDRVNHYLEACKRAGIRHNQRFLVMGDMGSLTKFPDEVRSSLDSIHQFVVELILENGTQASLSTSEQPIDADRIRDRARVLEGIEWAANVFSPYLENSRERYQHGIEYQLYLGAALDFVVQGLVARAT